MSKMELFILLDRLDNLCNSAPRVPMTDRVLIDYKELRELVDGLRLSLPKEVKQVQEIVKSGKEVHQQVRAEADGIISRAKQEAERLVQETEVYKRAQQEAEKTLREAKKKAAEICAGADEYAAWILSNLAESLNKTMAQLEKTLAQVERGQQELAKAKQQQQVNP